MDTKDRIEQALINSSYRHDTESLAKEVGVSTPTARKYIRQLKSEGKVAEHHVGRNRIGFSYVSEQEREAKAKAVHLTKTLRALIGGDVAVSIGGGVNLRLNAEQAELLVDMLESNTEVKP